MTGKELIKLAAVKNRLSDSLETGYEDDELVAYINDSINFVWMLGIDRQYYETIADYTFTQEQEPLPDDWYKATNQAALVERGRTADVYGRLPMKVRYYRTPQLIRTLDDELPFKNDGLNNIISQMVIILAMSNHEFNMDVEQDTVEAIVALM